MRGARRWNPILWAGFALTLLAVFSYIPIFTRYPLTRDFPWVNLLLLTAALALIAIGLTRAYGQPDRYRGKVSGAILAVLALVLATFFYVGVFRFARELPGAAAAPHPGQAAPDFTLADANGQPVALRNLLAGHRAVLLIFYRGYW